MGVEDALAGEIDRLYGLPLAEFTSERDALARRLRSEGSRDEAAEVAALRKPVLAAWVVNRLAREQRADVQALVAAAGAIRSGDPDADGRFRKTVDDLLRSAREQIAADGRRPTEAVLRDVATTLRAAAGAAPDLLTTGRLTEPFEATGFEAMAGAVPQRRGSTREKKKRTRRRPTGLGSRRRRRHWQPPVTRRGSSRGRRTRPSATRGACAPMPTRPSARPPRRSAPRAGPAPVVRWR